MSTNKKEKLNENKRYSLSDLIKEESKLVLEAENKYKEYWNNAIEFNYLLNNFIKEAKPEAMFFMLFYSQIKKHHTLAILSIVRKHSIQAYMNMRQVIESTIGAIYGFHFKDREDFVDKLEDGTIKEKTSFKKGKYKLIQEKYEKHSYFFKNQKKFINEGPAHSNLIYAFQNFEFSKDKGFSNLIFDKDDKLMAELILWFVGNTTLGILDLFREANQNENIITFVDDFDEKLKKLEENNLKLKEELEKEERFTKWL